MVDLLAGQRQPKESDKALIACGDYLRMGPGRSLMKLVEKYRGQSGGEPGVNLPPTKRLSTLEEWSAKFSWQARAAEYDAGWEERKNKIRERELNSGAAQDYIRVRKLKQLVARLELDIYGTSAPDSDESEAHASLLWLDEVKGIGSGDNFERVEQIRFNTGLVDQYRKLLGDIALEKGDRVHRHEHAGPDGGDIPVKTTVDGMRDILQMMGQLDKHGRAGNTGNPTQ